MRDGCLVGWLESNGRSVRLARLQPNRGLAPFVTRAGIYGRKNEPRVFHQEMALRHGWRTTR